MRAIRPLLAICILAGALNTARAQDELKAVIDKAIQAHGGEARLSKFQAIQMKGKGTIELMGQSFPFTQEAAFQLPNLMREDVELDIMGQKFKVSSVSNGQKAWLNLNGTTQELDGVMLTELKEAANFQRMNRFLALKDDKTYTLAALGEIQVDNKPAVGVKVSAKGHRDVNLYFDKASGLLTKVERRIVEPMTQQEMAEERLILEYQDSNGIKIAKKLIVKRDGAKFVEMEVTEAKSLEKLDPSMFAMP